MNIFDYHPLTFHIKGAEDEGEFNKFVEAYSKRNEEMVTIEKQIEAFEKSGQKHKLKRIKNIWIIKPGEITNRG